MYATSDVNGIRTYDLCDTSAVLYQANWEMVMLCICNMLVKFSEVSDGGEICEWFFFSSLKRQERLVKI